MQRKNQRNSKCSGENVRCCVEYLHKSRFRAKTLKVLWLLSFKKVTQVRTFFMMSLHISFRCWSRLMFSSIVLMEYTTVE